MWNSSTICSIRTTIRALLAPVHEIACARHLWRHVLEELRRRGEGLHEAGAFLLGTEKSGTRHIRAVVFYDELDPDAYSSGVCILHGDAFSKLWVVCREKGMTVVGDVHTHGGRATHSGSDRTNPMIARAGHVALIVPNFAKPPVRLQRLGVYQYLGAHRWRDLSGGNAKKHVRIGWW